MMAARATTAPARGPGPASCPPAPGTAAEPRPKAWRSKTQRSRSAFGRFGRFCCGFAVGRDGSCGNGLALLPDACALSDSSSQVEQLRPAPFAVPDDVDLVDTGRVQEEAAFHPDTMSDPANRKGLLGTAAPAADHDTFEDLDPLAGAPHHLRVHLDGVAGDQGGNVLALGFSFQQVDDVGHGVQGYHPEPQLPLVVDQV